MAKREHSGNCVVLHSHTRSWNQVNLTGLIRSRRFRWLFSAAIVWASLCVLWGWRNSHPEDMFELTIIGTPPDVDYQCVACDDGERTELLSEYWLNDSFGLRLHYTRRPSGIHYPASVYGPTELDAVAWRTGRRYGVIWRNVRGEWYRKWIPAERVESAPVESLPRRGSKTIRLGVGDPVERIHSDELTRLGLTWYVPGSPSAAECPGLLTSDIAQNFGIERKPVKSLSTLLGFALSLLEKGEGDSRACRDVSLLCYLAPKAIAQIPSATEDQIAAASELEHAYPGFVAALERSIGDAIRYLDQLKRLIQRIQAG